MVLTQLRQRLLERYGGDPRFVALRPTRESPAGGTVLEVNRNTRLRIVRAEGGSGAEVRFETRDLALARKIDDRISREGGSVREFLESRMGRVGLNTAASPERLNGPGLGIACQVAIPADRAEVGPFIQNALDLVEGLFCAFAPGEAEQPGD
ncbi:MAG: hypothetical protein QGI43_02075 [Gemmatimonadota bacterium]|nr:hypothetical protein [Gemmatimonadota bacterium]MDP6460779.1 hypothetical protein [Gemmatimonadota bacterium]MDP6528470.1 hypothetical protein [Gemmatimonadota bacterium]MDP7032284.1 hypothetical protein [Gemmatimonadota bacterium]